MTLLENVQSDDCETQTVWLTPVVITSLKTHPGNILRSLLPPMLRTDQVNRSGLFHGSESGKGGKAHSDTCRIRIVVFITV